MAEIDEILQDSGNLQVSGIRPAAEPGQVVSASGAGREGGGFLQSIFRALFARKKQVGAQRNPKSAQDWRDEMQAKNPWWGNGL